MLKSIFFAPKNWILANNVDNFKVEPLNKMSESNELPTVCKGSFNDFVNHEQSEEFLCEINDEWENKLKEA